MSILKVSKMPCPPKKQHVYNSLTEGIILNYLCFLHLTAQRKGKDVEQSTLDPTTQSALVMPDLCYIRDSHLYPKCSYPTLSVEIKVS